MPGLRAAELEVLYTANTAGVDKGEQKVKDSAQRIESKPVTQKVDADVSAAVAGMDRVEAAVGDFDAALLNAANSSRSMSSSLVRDFLESDRAAKKTAAEIEGVLVRSYGVSADAARQLALITKGELKEISTAASKTKVTVDVDGALAGMDRVENAAKQLVSQRAVLSLDARVTGAEKALDRARAKVEDLSILGNAGFDVTADTKRAETALARAEQQLERLQRARATVEVDADTASADAALDGLADKAGAAGSDAGASAGEELGESLITALQAIPVAGGIVLAGVAIGKAVTGAVRDGLQEEVNFDRLEALTGISPTAALRIGRAAGEAYANVFGDSVEANLNTARLAMQFRVIDPDATASDAQKTIEGLAGISDVMQEDVQPVARATASLLRSGLAASAREAFDLLAAGEREGVNLSQDLLDTLSEYGSTFKSMGLTGGQTLGLLNQGLRAGAPNTDFFADSLRELGIRIREGDDATAGFLDQLQLVPGDMRRAFIEGGPAARDALDQVFDRLRDTDPVDRNRIAVGLLGTQYEDLQLDLSQLDLSTAENTLNGVQGAAQHMFDTMANNDATKIDQAGRNIEVAMSGIQGALAAGFADPIAEGAKYIAENRGPVLKFFLDVANGALTFGDTMIDAAASGVESLGDVSGSLSKIVWGLAQVAAAYDQITPGDQSSLATGLTELANGMLAVDKTSTATAESMRTQLHDALDVARDKLNTFAEPAVQMGYLNDASLRLADSVTAVGTASDGTTLTLEGLNLANLSATDSGAQLERQIRDSVAAMQEELNAAARAGEGQEQLTSRYDTTTQALIDQLTQMGLTREQAEQLVGTYASLPQMITTAVTANTAAAENRINQLITTFNGATVRLNVATDSLDPTSIRRGYHGGIIQPMARGGIPDLTPMASTAAIVPADTWRVVGDRFDVPEAFVPMDNSPRSLAIQRELNARQPDGAPAPIQVNVGGITITGNPDTETILMVQRAVEQGIRDVLPTRP